MGGVLLPPPPEAAESGCSPALRLQEVSPGAGAWDFQTPGVLGSPLSPGLCSFTGWGRALYRTNTRWV